MRRKHWVVTIILLWLTRSAMTQPERIDDKQFFREDQPIEMKIEVDMKDLLAKRTSLEYVPAKITCQFTDSTTVQEEVRLKHRGNYRRQNCRLASLTIDFKNKTSPFFSKLGTLKMTAPCGITPLAEQYLLKEYLVYKIYNLLTDKSFRVRLTHVTFEDTRGKRKPYTQYAFLVEDVDDLAKRNNCREKEGTHFPLEYINREQATLLYIFQYMIGNTDWSVSHYHNIKLMVQKKDTLSYPYPVAYDFDMTGLVNPWYGATSPNLPIKRLTQRLYRGDKRSPAEIDSTLNYFFEKEEVIYSLINKFDPLLDKGKSEMIRFLREFFEETKDKKDRTRIFIDGALGN